MKILLTSTALKMPMTGIGRYVYYLMKGLQADNHIRQLVCMPMLQLDQADFSVKKIYFHTQLKKIIRAWPAMYTARNHYHNFLFRRRTHYLSAEKFIYHEPSYILRPYSGPKICNVHDLSPIYYPDCHPKGRVRFLLDYLPKSINDAQHIITSSYFMRREMINYFNIAAEKISVVYHGVADVFRPRYLNAIHTAIQRYGLLEKSYLLSVGTLEPRKNVARLIQAFSLLPESQRKKHPLVLVGIKGWGNLASKTLIKQLSQKEQLIFLGYVPTADLSALYSGAYAFVYLSLYEGFGLPVLEAMASGVPMLASNAPSLQEVVNLSALLVDPFDVDAIKNKLQQLLADDDLRIKLKQQGLLQASQFSWRSCIEKTVHVYRNTLKIF